MTAKKKSNGNGFDHEHGTSTGTETTINFNAKDPSQFQIPARDHQGHTVRVWCNIQPSIDHELNVILASKNWSFKMKGDIIRWAIWEGVKRLEKTKSVPGSMIVVAETIIESCRVSEQWLAFKTSVDKTESTVRSLMDSGNPEEALKLLSNLKSQVLRLEEASWREQWLGEFRKRFGHYLDQAKATGISLHMSEKEA